MSISTTQPTIIPIKAATVKPQQIYVPLSASVVVNIVEAVSLQAEIFDVALHPVTLLQVLDPLNY